LMRRQGIGVMSGQRHEIASRCRWGDRAHLPAAEEGQPGGLPPRAVRPCGRVPLFGVEGRWAGDAGRSLMR
jgi:hypothetical protein